MIFTKFKIHNLFSFANAELDLTIGRRLLRSTISDENLIKYPNFKFKKVCIISGSNASGKTALSHLFCFVQNLVCRPDYDMSTFTSSIANKNEKSSITAEFYSMDHLYELDIVYYENKFTYKIRCEKLRSNDSYFTVNRRLSFIESKIIPSVYKYFIEKINAGWLYIITNNEKNNSDVTDIKYLNAHLLFNILHSFDPSILEVKNIMDDENNIAGFRVLFSNGEDSLIDRQANPTNINRFSTGTYHAIQLSYFVGRVILDKNLKNVGNLYFLDEKMAYAHSDLEQSILNLIIESLPCESQFFYTTHNYDVLDMNIPIHSFVFLEKRNHKTTIMSAETKFTKNDRRLMPRVKNNLFNSLPSTDLIDELL